MEAFILPQRFVPLSRMKEMGEPLAGSGVTFAGLPKGAEGVVFGVFAQSQSNGIQIDIRCHQLECFLCVFDQNTIKTLFPECSGVLMSTVIPNSEALFQLLHENGEIAHSGDEAFAGVFGCLSTCFEAFFQFLWRHGVSGVRVFVKGGVAFEEFLVGNLFLMGDFEKNVKVIVEKAVG